MTQTPDLQSPAPSANAERPLGQALRRGFLGLCPNCGQGRIFQSFLKVRDRCPACGEELHHHRADDGPAYLTVLTVSHIGAPLLLWIFIAYRPSAISMLIGFSLGAILLSLILLPRVKGAMIAWQWARRMHGFDQDAHSHRGAA
ncbi:MAG: DUF983 domain-containing protein [Paracoccus sp. (in: a-proteobacteria)]|uniref:DUF983 domain-containing protein n=1 Tax=Paracoccus sp. TaxID=267 RepID=UPI0026DF0A2F|nr:DUF983 domain-containing protein [Paracoccus sp. (in: a-proteobacteria)]MDO5622065.1 DUF983 domain-containing protein [Paracoccus sp. (in: a-proteobacteria)]